MLQKLCGLLILLCVAITANAAYPPGHEHLVVHCTAGLIPRGGHIQGVQMLTIQGRQAILFSGSSNTWSYYAIAYKDEHGYTVKYVRRIAAVPFKHAGGMQVCGSILAVGIEDNSMRDKSRILLFDISDPGNSDKSPLDSIGREGKYEEATAGAVGITRYGKGYMIAVGDWGPNNIDTYVCDDTTRGNIHFKPFMSWRLQDAANKEFKSGKWASFQSIQLNSDATGNITLTGTARSGIKNIAETYNLKIKEGSKLNLDYGSVTKYPFSKGVSFRFGGGIMYKPTGIEVLATQRNAGKKIRVDYIH